MELHGIIVKGGVAANIVPDEAVAQFYFRAAKKETVMELVEKVKNIAQGAALMTGATLEMERFELPYDDLRTHENLSEVFNENLRILGIEDIEENEDFGSSDIGNVSHIVPTIHPNIGISNCRVIGHSREMADATISELGHERLLIGTLALAYTGYDVLTNKVEL